MHLNKCIYETSKNEIEKGRKNNHWKFLKNEQICKLEWRNSTNPKKINDEQNIAYHFISDKNKILKTGWEKKRLFTNEKHRCLSSFCITEAEYWIIFKGMECMSFFPWSLTSPISILWWKASDGPRVQEFASSSSYETTYPIIGMLLSSLHLILQISLTWEFLIKLQTHELVEDTLKPWQ